MAGALLSPVSYGQLEFFGFEPHPPYRITVHEAGANSGNTDPKPAIRTRHDSPTQYTGQPWTTRAGTQRGRVWLHASNEFPYGGAAPHESGGYIHVKTGFFGRHDRDHTGESASNRYGNLYGWGDCRAKELNGQIVMGNPCFVVSPPTGQFIEHTSTDADGCNVAELSDDPTYRACPPGLLPVPEYRVGQDGSGVIWKSYTRMPLDIPQGVTIVEARIALYIGDVGSAFDCNIRIMSSDDVDDFTSTAANTNSLASTVIGPITLAPTTGSGAAYSLTEDFTDLIQHVVNRPGWTSGNFIGFEIAPESGLVNGQIHSLAWSQANPSMALSVLYRDETYDDSPPAIPPRVHGYQRLYTTRTIDTSNGPEMNESPGGGISSSKVFHRIADYRAGSEYKWMVFTPVPEISTWHVQEDHGDPIYGPDAHNFPYPFNEIGTQEFPCPGRDAPYAYRSLGDPRAFVYPNIRAAIAYAGKPPKPGIEPIYNENCTGYEASAMGLQESLIQTYEGMTATTRYYHPSSSTGWWIEYTGHILGWLVYGDERDFLGMAYGSDPDSYGPYIHWNCWWEMKVVAKWHGPPRTKGLWSLFSSWVNTLENRFGADVQPRTQDQCNDILLRCAGVNCALGDIVRPSQSIQEDDCEGDATLDTGRKLPCVDAGNVSRWYLPTLGSNHPTTPSGGPVVPQMPESGLWHEFERVAFKNPEQTSSETDYGWMSVLFQTNHPVIRGVPSVGDPFPRNRIEEWIPADPINSETLISLLWKLQWTDVDGIIGVAGDTYTSGFMSDGLSAAQLQTQCDAVFGPDNTSVSKTSSSPETFEVEFIGDLAGMNAFNLQIEIVDYSTDPADEFEFTRNEIQSGKPGGFTP